MMDREKRPTRATMLGSSAMLVAMRITAWSGRAYDREASEDIAARHEASRNAGRYNKRLLPRAALAALGTTMSEVRATHYEHTLPWEDNSTRLLTVANYDAYTTHMNTLRERMVAQRTRFIADYEGYIEQARIDLGKLFRIENYPPKEKLQNKFTMSYHITPVPDANHFIAQLTRNDTEMVKRDIEQRIEQKLNVAVDDLYRRLAEAVEHVSSRLEEDQKGKPLVFRDSMIKNIRDLVEIVPRLNVFGDEKLAHMCEQVKEKIANVDPNVLRPSKVFDPTTRSRVKHDADALAEKLAGYFLPPAQRGAA